MNAFRERSIMVYLKIFTKQILFINEKAIFYIYLAIIIQNSRHKKEITFKIKHSFKEIICILKQDGTNNLVNY